MYLIDTVFGSSDMDRYGFRHVVNGSLLGLPCSEWIVTRFTTYRFTMYTINQQILRRRTRTLLMQHGIVEALLDKVQTLNNIDKTAPK